MSLTSSLFSGISNAKLRWLIIATVAVIGACTDYYLFYPGFVSPDTLDQFTQALHNSYGNWHPPTMAALWHLLLPLGCGPQPMLMLQLIFLWLAFALLFDIALHQNKIIAIILILIVLSPFVQNVVGNVWKDLQMSLSWFLAFAWITHAWYWQRKIAFTEFILCLIVIYYGIWVRISGFPATLPLLFFLWKNTALKQRYRSSTFALLAAISLCVFSLGLEKLFSKKVLQAHDDHIEYKLILHDLSGLSLRSGKNLFPPYIKTWQGFNWEYISKNYRIESFDNIWWNPEKLSLFPSLTDEQHSQLKTYWRRTLLQNGFMYLKMKYDGTLFFLRIKESGSSLMIMHPYIYSNNFGIKLPENKYRDLVFEKIAQKANKPYMKPWFWLLLNAFLYLPLVYFRKDKFSLPAMVLNLSATLYLLIHFFVYPADTEFRYFYWYSLSCSISAFLLLLIIAGRLNRSKNNDPRLERLKL